VTTRTFSDSSDRREARTVARNAFQDELLKIAMSEARKSKLKNFAKSTATIAAGAGVGYGSAMLAEKAFLKMIGSRFSTLPQSQQNKILGAALGVSLAGSYVARNWLDKERAKAKE